MTVSGLAWKDVFIVTRFDYRNLIRGGAGVIFLVLYLNAAIIIASSGDTDAAGIRGWAGSYDIAPVWGSCIASGVTARTSAATAPSAAAREAPELRYATVVP